ncbi:response regulator transcription factor [Pedobacter psychrodurus]|uniref:Response regulator transcription factor n=1 Tax=Pedobacter psychrodurus TaxID=2530456 RepID=A0A4R0Q6A9_9SPHI|nr:LytTR family DNA-binding domain-containing protein [Pedobacter psychrodurus]TCD28719.1 response regulator transcription factor [Pedobacter psychrodurus]
MNCIIVDDEPFAREGMSSLIANFPGLHLKGSFNNALSANEFLTENNIDLVFLDIQMPGETGLELARRLPKETLVIFTTAYSEHALESYEVDGIDYLVKPITSERFAKAVDKASMYFSLRQNKQSELDNVADHYIMIRADRRFYKIDFSSILYIEGLKDYVIIYTQDNKYITWMNLKTIHSKLPERLFLRVSKSYVINQQAITSFDTGNIYLGEVKIPLGKAYQKDFLTRFNGQNEV